MKVPHKVTGMTRPSAQGLASFQDSSGLAAQGLQQLASATAGLGAVLKQRQDSVDQFSSIQNMEEFDQRLNIMATEQRRSADPADTTIAERNLALFDNLTAETLQKIPESQRAAAEAEFAKKKTGFMSGSYAFQYEQQDSWYRQGVADSLTAGQLSVDKDWSEANVGATLETVKKKIAATDLPEVEKQKLLRETELLLRSTQLKKAAVAGEVAQSTPKTGKKVAGGSLGKQLGFVVHELTGRESGTNAQLKKAGTLDEAVAAFVGYERPQGWTPGNPRGAHGYAQRLKYAQQVLAGTASPQAMQARAYLEEQGYTDKQASGIVGNLMQESGPKLNPNAMRKNDAGPGNHSVGIGQWNRERLAAMQKFTGETADIDLPDGSGLAYSDDPRFANIPLDQREAIFNDARIIRNREQAETEASQKLQHESMMNNFLQDIYSGKRGKADIYKAWDGDEIDYSDVTKLEEAWNKNNKKNDALTEGLAGLSRGTTLTEGQANAVAEHYDEAGVVLKRDPEGLAAIWQRTQAGSYLPPSTQNLLISKTTAENPADAAFCRGAVRCSARTRRRGFCHGLAARPRGDGH